MQPLIVGGASRARAEDFCPRNLRTARPVEPLEHRIGTRTAFLTKGEGSPRAPTEGIPAGAEAGPSAVHVALFRVQRSRGIDGPRGGPALRVRDSSPTGGRSYLSKVLNNDTWACSQGTGHASEGRPGETLTVGERACGGKGAEPGPRGDTAAG